MSAFNILISRLATIGEKIDEKEKATLLLCLMPESWDTLIMNISKDMYLTYESTEFMFLVAESHRKINGGGSSNDTALMTHSIFKERDGGGKD